MTNPPDDLLRAALEKVVYFEWRVEELSRERDAALATRAAALTDRDEARAEVRRLSRSLADAEMALTESRARVGEADARARAAELESQRARSTAVADRVAPAQALRAELEAAQAQALRETEARMALLSRMVEMERARESGEDESPLDLGAFIAELRGEVETVRQREVQLVRALTDAGVAIPAAEAPRPVNAPLAAPRQSTRELGERLAAEGRLDISSTLLAPPPAAPPSERALFDLCLRDLAARDPAIRRRAAERLGALAFVAGAPALAASLPGETEPSVRAALVRAVVICGGDGSRVLARRALAEDAEPSVRLAALEALADADAVEIASLDAAAAVRRLAAAIAAGIPEASVALERLKTDDDASVRRASTIAQGGSGDAPEVADDILSQTLSAVRASLRGRSVSEVARAVSLSPREVQMAAARLLAEGRLVQRGDRLYTA